MRLSAEQRADFIRLYTLRMGRVAQIKDDPEMFETTSSGLNLLTARTLVDKALCSSYKALEDLGRKDIGDTIVNGLQRTQPTIIVDFKPPAL